MPLPHRLQCRPSSNSSANISTFGPPGSTYSYWGGSCSSSSFTSRWSSPPTHSATLTISTKARTAATGSGRDVRRFSLMLVRVAWLATTAFTLPSPTLSAVCRARLDRPGSASARARRRMGGEIHGGRPLAGFLARRRLPRFPQNTRFYTQVASLKINSKSAGWSRTW